MLPARARSPEASDASESLRLSFLHEVAHAERSDPWFNLAGSVAQAFWFLLMPSGGSAWTHLYHEFLADHRAASGFGSSGKYAASLLELSPPRREGPAPASRAPVPAEGPVSALFQRLLMLVRCPFPVETRPPRWWRWSLPMGVALATLAASSLSHRGVEAAPPPGPGRLLAPPGPQSFRMARLELPASPGGPDGRAPAFHLPIRLPDDFELTLEVWGDPDMLSRIRVAGHLLGTTQTLASDPTAPEAWHLLPACARVPCCLHVWIDGHSSTAVL